MSHTARNSWRGFARQTVDLACTPLLDQALPRNWTMEQAPTLIRIQVLFRSASTAREAWQLGQLLIARGDIAAEQLGLERQKARGVS